MCVCVCGVEDLEKGLIVIIDTAADPNGLTCGRMWLLTLCQAENQTFELFGSSRRRSSEKSPHVSLCVLHFRTSAAVLQLSKQEVNTALTKPLSGMLLAASDQLAPL